MKLYILELVVSALAVLAVCSISTEAETLADATCMAFSKQTLAPKAALLLPGVTGHCIYSGTRCWLQYVPEERTKNVPLLVSLHGGGSCAEYRMAYDNARKQGWIVVWPQAAGMPWPRVGMGIMSSWNGDGHCCGPQAINNAVDDVAFVRQVIMNVIANVKGITKTQIYMTGHSMGCMLAHRFIIAHSDLIAAMSCTSHTMGQNTVPLHVSTVTPTPILIIAGFIDKDTYFAGRRGKPLTKTDVIGVPWGLGYPYPQVSAFESIEEMSNTMRCKNISQTPEDPSLWPTSVESRYAFNGTGCPKNRHHHRSIVSVSLLVLPKCGHMAYQGKDNCTFPTTETQYNFFRDGPKQSDAEPEVVDAVAEEIFTKPADSGIADYVILGGLVLVVMLFAIWQYRGGSCPCTPAIDDTPMPDGGSGSDSDSDKDEVVIELGSGEITVEMS